MYIYRHVLLALIHVESRFSNLDNRRNKRDRRLNGHYYYSEFQLSRLLTTPWISLYIHDQSVLLAIRTDDSAWF